MNLVILTHFPKDPGMPHGGVESVSVTLVNELKSFTDITLTVVTLDCDIDEILKTEWQGITIYRLPRPKNSELVNAISFGRKTILKFVQKLNPDIVHAHDTYGMMVKGLNLPRVFTVHGFIYGDTLFSSKGFKKTRSHIWKYFETRAWAEQPNVISISPYVRERLSAFSKAQIFDIDNPINDKFFELKRKVNGNRIFSAAAICPRKNPLALVKAVAILLNNGIQVDLHLAGKITDTTYGEQLADYITSHNLSDHVKILGPVSQDSILTELAEASIFALVSYEENSPMGIEEAMAVGVPVVTSNCCGMPYMVRHNESGFLVNPDSCEDIASSFKMILEDAGLANSMSDKSREIALDRFHSKKVAGRTVMVYKEILKKKM